MVAKCDQPGTTSTSSPWSCNALILVAAVLRFLRKTNLTDMAWLALAAKHKSTATWVAPEKPPVTKWTTRGVVSESFCTD